MECKAKENHPVYIKTYTSSKCINSCGKIFSDCSCHPMCLKSGDCCSDYKFCEAVEKYHRIEGKIENCKFSTKDGTTCLQCRDNFFLFDNKCQKSCPLNSIIFSSNNICLKKTKCPDENCIKCSNGKCVKCLYGMFLHENKCLTSCPVGFRADRVHFTCHKKDQYSFYWIFPSKSGCNGRCGLKDINFDCSCKHSCLRKGNCCDDFESECAEEFYQEGCKLCTYCFQGNCHECKENSSKSDSSQCECNEGYHYDSVEDICVLQKKKDMKEEEEISEESINKFEKSSRTFKNKSKEMTKNPDDKIKHVLKKNPLVHIINDNSKIIKLKNKKKSDTVLEDDEVTQKKENVQDFNSISDKDENLDNKDSIDAKRDNENPDSDYDNNNSPFEKKQQNPEESSNLIDKDINSNENSSQDVNTNEPTQKTSETICKQVDDDESNIETSLSTKAQDKTDVNDNIEDVPGSFSNTNSFVENLNKEESPQAKKDKDKGKDEKNSNIISILEQDTIKDKNTNMIENKEISDNSSTLLKKENKVILPNLEKLTKVAISHEKVKLFDEKIVKIDDNINKEEKDKKINNFNVLNDLNNLPLVLHNETSLLGDKSIFQEKTLKNKKISETNKFSNQNEKSCDEEKESKSESNLLEKSKIEQSLKLHKEENSELKKLIYNITDITYLINTTHGINSNIIDSNKISEPSKPNELQKISVTSNITVFEHSSIKDKKFKNAGKSSEVAIQIYDKGEKSNELEKNTSSQTSLKIQNKNKEKTSLNSSWNKATQKEKDINSTFIPNSTSINIKVESINSINTSTSLWNKPNHKVQSDLADLIVNSALHKDFPSDFKDQKKHSSNSTVLNLNITNNIINKNYNDKNNSIPFEHLKHSNSLLHQIYSENNLTRASNSPHFDEKILEYVTNLIVKKSLKNQTQNAEEKAPTYVTNHMPVENNYYYIDNRNKQMKQPKKLNGPAVNLLKLLTMNSTSKHPENNNTVTNVYIQGDISINLLIGNENPKIITTNVFNNHSFNSFHDKENQNNNDTSIEDDIEKVSFLAINSTHHVLNIYLKNTTENFIYPNQNNHNKENNLINKSKKKSDSVSEKNLR